MKSILLFSSLAALSVTCISAGCSSTKDDTKDTGGSSTGATESGGGTKNAAGEKSAAGENTGATSNTAGETGGGGAPGGAGETGSAGESPTGVSAITSCTTGQLYLGDPTWNGDQDAVPVAKGQDLLADPPLFAEATAVIGTHLFLENEQEIWSVDLSATKPQLARIAGKKGAGFINAGVACADTTFLVIRDMTATADGKLVLIDYTGGAVLEITDPGTAACKSVYVAGTHAKTADPGQEYPLAQGDMDGPGAGALFGKVSGGGGINKVATDPDGNIYTYDTGTGKFKVIGTDKARTVATIGVITSTDDNVMGLTWLKGKLYAIGVDGTNDFLQVIDPAKYKVATPKANVTDVYRARDHFEDVEAGHQAITSQLYNDGEALIMSSQAGFVWRVDTDGTVLATLAGSGAFIEFSSDFDPTKPHAATEWELVSQLSNNFGGPWLSFSGTKMFWTGGIGIGKYTVQFNCK